MLLNLDILKNILCFLDKGQILLFISINSFYRESILWKLITFEDKNKYLVKMSYQYIKYLSSTYNNTIKQYHSNSDSMVLEIISPNNYIEANFRNHPIVIMILDMFTLKIKLPRNSVTKFTIITRQKYKTNESKIYSNHWYNDYLVIHLPFPLYCIINKSYRFEIHFERYLNPQANLWKTIDCRPFT